MNYALVRTTFFSVALFFLSITAFGQLAVEYELLYNDTECKYEVHAHVSGGSIFLGPAPGGAQVTIAAPASVSNATFTAETVNPPSSSWVNSFSKTVYAPAANPNFDYHAFNLVNANIPYSSFADGDDIHLFSFEIPGDDCASGIRLYINGTDPSSADPGMNLSDFSNGFSVIHNGVEELYTQNISDAPLHDQAPTTNMGFNCTSTEISLSANATAVCSTISSYQWTGPNDFSSTDENPVITIEADPSVHIGTYELMVTDARGCTTMEQTYIDDTNCLMAPTCGPLLINNNNGTADAIMPDLYKGTTIDSDGYVAPGTNVDFEAESYIELAYPFEVAQGAIFSGTIVPCDE